MVQEHRRQRQGNTEHGKQGAFGGNAAANTDEPTKIKGITGLK